jgi:hypothetical protein
MNSGQRSVRRPVIRPIPAEGFLKSNGFKRWHAETIECVEHLQQRFGLRLDKVFWKAALLDGKAFYRTNQHTCPRVDPFTTSL